MTRLFTVFSVVVIVLLKFVPGSWAAADPASYQAALERRYSTPHSLGDRYQFDPRDGWETVNVSNLAYKYARSEPEEEEEEEYDNLDLEEVEGNHSVSVEHHKRYSKAINLTTLGKRSKKSSSKKAKTHKKSKSSSKKTSKKLASKKSTKKTTSKSVSKTSSATGGLTGSLKSIIDSMTGTGSPQPVTITWYTGHDLLNPSCWSNPTWHPTDASMACALTLEGWTTRPKCFKFIELCNSPQKCVFVRVVDSCAGCAKGSKHVDLTKNAFSGLADLDEGLLTVQMRPATDPDGWVENLWGPKSN